MRTLGAPACVAMLMVSAAGCATVTTAPEASRPQQVELLRGAKIEVSDAIKAATTKAPGRVLDTELRAKGGHTVWEVDVLTADGKVVEVDVDATSGQAVDSEEHR